MVIRGALNHIAAMPGIRSTPQIALIGVLSLVLAGCGKDSAAPPPAASAPVAIAAAAQPQPKPKAPPFPFAPPIPVPPPREGTKINPASLRQLLLRDNISVLESLNSVYKANEQVAAAHANLAPSISIAPALSGSTFGIGGITFMLPFLAPSNWYNLDLTKHQLAASGYAFYLVELNEYASAYTLYLSMLADQEIEQNQQIHYGNVEQIRKFVESQVKLGQADQADLDQATAVSELQHASLLDFEDNINSEERLAFAKVLGFDLGKKYYLEDFHPTELPEETADPRSVLATMFRRSPEELQVESLLAAARDATWSAQFSFLGGGAPSMNLAYDGNPFTVTGTSPGFGIGLFPQVELGRIAQRDLELRSRQIYLEEQKLIGSTLGKLGAAKREFVDAEKAEGDARKAYVAIQNKFAHDKASLNDVTGASDLVIEASITRIKTRLKLDTQRVNLARFLLSREFAQIPNCHLDRMAPEGGPFGWLERIFSPEKVRASVDELCRARR
jgi:multidrug efflux system outer membrane protein